MSDRDRDRGMMERMGRTVGGAAGRAADTAAKMTMPLLRATADVLGGWWSRDEARQAAASWDDERDRRAREHFEQQAARASQQQQAGGTGAPRSYDEARPLYQLGHTAARNPDYRGRGFDEVEPDLRRVWAEGRIAGEADAGAASGRGEAGGSVEAEGSVGTDRDDWPDARAYIEFGYGDGG